MWRATPSASWPIAPTGSGAHSSAWWWSPNASAATASPARCSTRSSAARRARACSRRWKRPTPYRSRCTARSGSYRPVTSTTCRRAIASCSSTNGCTAAHDVVPCPFSVVRWRARSITTTATDKGQRGSTWTSPANPARNSAAWRGRSSKLGYPEGAGGGRVARMRGRRQWIALAAVLLVAAALRIYKLEDLPAGLYCDEAGNGYNAYALGAAGIDENGVHWPLY